MLFIKAVLTDVPRMPLNYPQIDIDWYIYIYIRTLKSRTVPVSVYKTVSEPIQEYTALHSTAGYDKQRWNSLSIKLSPISVLQKSDVLSEPSAVCLQRLRFACIQLKASEEKKNLMFTELEILILPYWENHKKNLIKA